MQLFKKEEIKYLIEISHDEILDGYEKSKYNTKDYGLRSGLAFYISSVDGLNCAFSSEEFEELYNYRTNNGTFYEL